ncbi:MAG: hypothetical protein IJZ94_02135 [Clostridia bacterium]|nr:hypothetical protein [Clostridia bacterium]
MEINDDIIYRNCKEYIDCMNKKYADYKEVPYGLDITKKTDVIGICYSTWFTKILSQPGYSKPVIPDILAGKRDFDGEGAFHYWSEPALGFYKSDDKDVIRTHMTQIYELGVDYIIIDNTNAGLYWHETARGTDWDMFITRPCTAILDTITEMRSEGKKTPYVVFWTNVNDRERWGVAEETYEQFLSQEKWKDCFVYMEGKPFMLVTNMIPGRPKYDMTIRKQWGLNQRREPCEWSFLNVINNPTLDCDGFSEQMCVCTATQQTFMSLTDTAKGRDGGKFLNIQWQNAFKYRPKVLTLTWWNEWAAQLFYDENRNPLFVDNYTPEYSRDIEPMKGGHGDLYYRWTKQYIEAYRNHKKCPVLIEEKK